MKAQTNLNLGESCRQSFTEMVCIVLVLRRPAVVLHGLQYIVVGRRAIGKPWSEVTKGVREGRAGIRDNEAGGKQRTAGANGTGTTAEKSLKFTVEVALRRRVARNRF